HLLQLAPLLLTLESKLWKLGTRVITQGIPKRSGVQVTDIFFPTIMTTLFDGELALVTGGGSGIGRSVCQVLDREGAKVIAADLNYTNAKETVNLLKDPVQHLAISMDVTKPDSVKVGLSEIMKKFEAAPTLLVNSAGILRTAPFLSEELTNFSNVMDVNLKGSFVVSQAVANAMTQHGLSGSIVNIASIAAKVGHPNYASYCSSKGAVVSFSATIAKELASKGIRVNCVLPGIIRTPMMEGGWNDDIDIVIKELTPLGREGKPEEVAEVIAFLLSKRSSYMVGACLEITGGLHM
ncbi:hypothetical protein SK128_018845, partial [Halocaridina rubra]